MSVAAIKRSGNAAVLLIALLQGAAWADDAPDWVAAVNQRVASYELDGASGVLRIARDGTVLLQRGFGSADCRGKEPATPQHHFMIGSITKELTRVLGYVLEERGLIDFDAPLSDYLADLDGPAGSVTIRQTLDHTGGLPDLIDADGAAVPYSIEYDYIDVSRDELIKRAAKAQLIFDPGTSEEYSNLGYQLLAATFEAVTEDSYADLLQRYLFAPAAMTATAYWFNDGGDRQFADGCEADDEHWGNPIDDAMWGESGPSWNLLGAGGLISTATSLARFLEGIGSGVFFESAAQSERYKSERMVFSKRRQQRVMGPAGSNGVFNAVAYWADGAKLSVIVMTNRAEHPAEGGLVREIITLIADENFEPMPE